MSKNEIKGQIEFQLYRAGEVVAGVDEVGRGCLAGPVMASCVVLDYIKLESLKQSDLKLIRDSKTLSHPQRASIVPVIKSICIDAAIGVATSDEVESLGISHATFTAMRRAIEKILTPVSMVLVDGNQTIPSLPAPQRAIVKGDRHCYAIAAASILAKEERDQFMRRQAIAFPNYCFDSNMGYGTKEHLSAIERFGACSLHRKNFEPIKSLFL